VDLKSELPIEPPVSESRPRRIWPYVWLALAGVAMAAWFAGIVWVVVIFVRLLWDF
jgi:hypothetical protein